MVASVAAWPPAGISPWCGKQAPELDLARVSTRVQPPLPVSLFSGPILLRDRPSGRSDSSLRRVSSGARWRTSAPRRLSSCTVCDASLEESPCRLCRMQCYLRPAGVLSFIWPVKTFSAFQVSHDWFLGNTRRPTDRRRSFVDPDLPLELSPQQGPRSPRNNLTCSPAESVKVDRRGGRGPVERERFIAIFILRRRFLWRFHRADPSGEATPIDRIRSALLRPATRNAPYAHPTDAHSPPRCRILCTRFLGRAS